MATISTIYSGSVCPGHNGGTKKNWAWKPEEAGSAKQRKRRRERVAPYMLHHQLCATTTGTEYVDLTIHTRRNGSQYGRDSTGCRYEKHIIGKAVVWVMLGVTFLNKFIR